MSDSKKEDVLTYMQFYPNLDIPIYVSFSLESFSPELFELLLKNGFVKIEEKEVLKLPETLKNNRFARILKITEASLNIAKKIDYFREDDKFGAETVTPKKGYSIYRFRGIGIMIYSFGSKQWELGCFSDFGSQEIEAANVVINRFVSWALAGLGTIGFWGVPVDNGIVVMNQADSKGEVVYVDIFNNMVFSVDGMKKIKSNFRIIRLDATLKNRNIMLRPSELLSFLIVNCTYFDYYGLSVPVRQVIRKMSSSIPGILHPKESFRPRTDLGL